MRRPVGFELSLVKRPILGREAFIFHAELFEFGFEGFKFPFRVEGQVAIPVTIHPSIRNQDLGPRGRKAVQMRAGISVGAFETPGGFLIPSHSRVIRILLWLNAS